jgi:hypothetical protein
VEEEDRIKRKEKALAKKSATGLITKEEIRTNCSKNRRKFIYNNRHNRLLQG